VAEKNGLRDKVLGMDKSLREIYSAVITREEEKRSGLAKEQIAQKEAVEKLRAGEKEKVQRQQWAPISARKQQEQAKGEGYLSRAPKAIKERLEKSGQQEEEQRTKFLHEVESWSDKGKNQPQVLQNQANIAPPPVPKHQIPPAPSAPAVPHK
jgi:hypothetical protein